METPRHKEVAIEIGGKMVEIDVGIAPLVATLNRLPGVATIWSCQDIAEAAWVFFGLDDAHGRPARDAALWHLLRQIDRALTGAGLWSRVTLNFGCERLWCVIEVRPEDIMQAAHEIERLNLAGSKPSPCFWRL